MEHWIYWLIILSVAVGGMVIAWIGIAIGNDIVDSMTIDDDLTSLELDNES